MVVLLNIRQSLDKTNSHLSSNTRCARAIRVRDPNLLSRVTDSKP